MSKSAHDRRHRLKAKKHRQRDAAFVRQTPLERTAVRDLAEARRDEDAVDELRLLPAGKAADWLLGR